MVGNMSGFIAVSVSLIGLSGVLFTLAIFIQMILSFPAMLSSNSQTYVQQQRKAYTIGPAPVVEEFDQVEVEVEVDVDEELEEYDEPETDMELELELDEIDDSVARWIEVVDEAMNISNVKPKPATTRQISQGRKSTAGTSRAEPITRGRSRRRTKAQTGISRPGLRSNNPWRRLGEQTDDNDDDDDYYYFETEDAHETENRLLYERQHWNPAWRNSMVR